MKHERRKWSRALYFRRRVINYGERCRFLHSFQNNWWVTVRWNPLFFAEQRGKAERTYKIMCVPLINRGATPQASDTFIWVHSKTLTTRQSWCEHRSVLTVRSFLSCVPMVASGIAERAQRKGTKETSTLPSLPYMGGCNWFQAETALHQGICMARKACALKGEPWVLNRLARRRKEYNQW